MPWDDGRTYDRPADWWARTNRVRRRDGHRCVRRLPSGKRCPRTTHLEVNHIVRPADGGSHELDNLETLCKDHHRQVTQQQSEAGKMRWKNEKPPEEHPGKGGTT